MLFAKINPTAKVATQDGPFTVMGNDAHWMTAGAQYNLGQQYTRFTVRFGNFSEPQDPSLPAEPAFKPMLTFYEDFTADQLSTWGEDDTAAFQIIAARIGTTIIEVVDKPEIDAV